MSVKVHFYSYFKDLTGCSDVVAEVDSGTTLEALYEQLAAQFPKLAAMRNSTLMAVGLDYQPKSYVLNPCEEVSLFPPVQGG